MATVGRIRVRVRGALVLRNARCSFEDDRPGTLHKGSEGVYDTTTGVESSSGRIEATLDNATKSGEEFDWDRALDGTDDATLTLEGVGGSFRRHYTKVLRQRASGDGDNESGKSPFNISWIGVRVKTQ